MPQRKGSREAAARFAKAVTNEMQTLSMKGGRFEVKLVPIPRSEVGVEKSEFLMAGHPGVDVSPLAKVASGGELSRIGLAIFTLTSRNTSVPTLIFDEVDSGVGGKCGERKAGTVRDAFAASSSLRRPSSQSREGF